MLAACHPHNDSNAAGKEKDKGVEWCSIQPKCCDGVRVVLRRVSPASGDISPLAVPPRKQADSSATPCTHKICLHRPCTPSSNIPGLHTTTPTSAPCGSNPTHLHSSETPSTRSSPHSFTVPKPGTPVSAHSISLSPIFIPSATLPPSPISTPSSTLMSPHDPITPVTVHPPPVSASVVPSPSSDQLSICTVISPHTPVDLHDPLPSSNTLSACTPSCLPLSQSPLQTSQSCLLSSSSNRQCPPNPLYAKGSLPCDVQFSSTTLDSNTCTTVLSISPPSSCKSQPFSNVIPLPPLSPPSSALSRAPSTSSLNSYPVLSCKVPLQPISPSSSPHFPASLVANSSTPFSSVVQSPSSPPKSFCPPLPNSSPCQPFGSPPSNMQREFTSSNITSPLQIAVNQALPVSRPPTPCTPPALTNSSSTYPSSPPTNSTPSKLPSDASPPILSPPHMCSTPRKISVIVSSSTPPKLLPAVPLPPSKSVLNLSPLYPQSVLRFSSSPIKTSVVVTPKVHFEESCQISRLESSPIKIRRTVRSKTFDTSTWLIKQNQRKIPQRNYKRKKLHLDASGKPIELPYKCRLCEQSVATSAGLARHVTRIHGSDADAHRPRMTRATILAQWATTAEPTPAPAPKATHNGRDITLLEALGLTRKLS